MAQHRWTIRTHIFILFILPFAAFCFSAVALAQDSSLEETLAADDRLTVLNTLIQESGLGETLDGTSEYTLFAPTDEAFDQIPSFALDYLMSDADLLRRVLEFHLVAGRQLAADVLALDSLTTAEGEALAINPDVGRVNSANILETDIEATDGVIHVIDRVLIPEITLPPFDPFSSFDNVTIAGSSTVAPVTERMKELFEREGFSGSISVEVTGSNVGLERFCVNAELDIANASRPIREEEIEACRENGLEPVGFFIGVDALAVTMNQENAFVDNLTIEQLAQIFSGDADTWDDINPGWPPQPIQVLSPGADSGTMVYFVDEVFDGEEMRLLAAPNTQFSEDDTVLVDEITANPFAIGYFGYAYFVENADVLRVVDIERVAPNDATAESGEYPLSRPLFIYTSPSLIRDKPQVAEFINYYLTNVQAQLGTAPGQIGYFPASSDLMNLSRLIWLASVEG